MYSQVLVVAQLVFSIPYLSWTNIEDLFLPCYYYSSFRFYTSCYLLGYIKLVNMVEDFFSQPMFYYQENKIEKKNLIYWRRNIKNMNQ